MDIVSAHQALSDRAFSKLCWMPERSDLRLPPDHIWLSHEPEIYGHLREIHALTLTSRLASEVLCRSCCAKRLIPLPYANAAIPDVTYRGYCIECGWRFLRSEDVYFWMAQPQRLVTWIAKALRLTSRYQVETLTDGKLWRLGELNHSKHRRAIFFGRRLMDDAHEVQRVIRQHAAPGIELLITSSDTSTLKSSVLEPLNAAPIRAIARLCKDGLAIKNLEAYLDFVHVPSNVNETSLSPLHAQRAVLIEGRLYPITKQIYQFLSLLQEAEGDELHKSHIADAMGVTQDRFKPADIFKRHRIVRETFVISTNDGRYRLNEAFVT